MVKRMLKKCVDSKQHGYKGLLEYRATPLDIGLSPSQLHRTIDSVLRNKAYGYPVYEWVSARLIITGSFITLFHPPSVLHVMKKVKPLSIT